MKNILVLVLVGAAAVAAHRASSPASELHGSEGAAAAEHANANSPDMGARVKHGIGRFGSVLAGPVVRSMSLHTNQLLEDLQPAIARARPREAIRARKLTKQILQADSVAHEMLAVARPIEALRYAMFGKGLIPSVRQTLVEETAFR